jgi:hypothetical protein
MAFNLGSFAGGLARGGVQTYQTLTELEQKQKELEQRQQLFELQKAAAEREATKFEQEQAAGEIYKQSAMPVGQEGTGVSMGQAVGALSQDQTPGSQAPEMTDTGRAELTAALSKLPPEQATQALRAYQNMATPTEGGIDIGKATIYKGADGMPMATNQTKELSGLEQAKRFKDLAMASGNITAIDKANLYYNQAFQTAKLEREQKYDQKLDEFSDKQASVMHALQHLPDVGLEKAPDLVNKDLKGFGLTAKYVPPTGDAAKKQAIGGTPMGMVEVRDSEGKVIGTFNSVSDIQAALNSHMEDYHQNTASELAQMLPNAADRIKFMQDAQRLTMEKAKLKLTERGVAVEESKADQQKRELDEKIRVNLFGAEAASKNAAANASNAHANYFNAEAGMAKLKANLMNSDVKAREAAQPYLDAYSKLTPDEQKGEKGIALIEKAAVTAATKSTDFSRLLIATGANKAPKEPITNADLLKFQEQNSGMPSGIFDQKTGKELTVGQVPIDQVKGVAERMFHKGEGGGGGLPSDIKPAPRTSAPVPAAPAALATTAATAPATYGNISPEMQSQAKNKLYAANVALQQAEKEAAAAAASGNRAAIIQAGNNLNQARAARDEAARSPLLK